MKKEEPNDVEEGSEDAAGNTADQPQPSKEKGKPIRAANQGNAFTFSHSMSF